MRRAIELVAALLAAGSVAVACVGPDEEISGEGPEDTEESAQPITITRQMEALDRGVVAVKVSNGVFVSWRLLGTDPTSIAFNVYRGGTKVNSAPITDSTNLLDAAGTTGSTYTVRPILNGAEQAPSAAAPVWAQNYLKIPLQTPAGYTPGDASVGDLDGDGKYEIVVKQEMTPKDNSQAGVTGQTLLEAYRLDGAFLWRINLGKNIREGAHYTQFMVYDLDGDGRAEVACKTADGTTDGQGNVIGNASADYRNADGYILSGPEYLTVFNGLTGAAMATASYVPPRGTVSSWGDSYGNRVDRFLAGVAYLDGARPSLIMARGYYTRAVVSAWNWRNGALSQVWTFDTESGNSQYRGQGNHNLSIGDVDADGKDEIIYGAAAINDNGTGLYSTGLGHGDALHLSDMDPNHPGLEVFACHETPSATAGLEYRDADSGQLLFGIPSSGDVGRALAMDIDPTRAGFEGWVAGGGIGGVYHLATGTKIANTAPAANFGVWWDADPLREILNGEVIDKWNHTTGTTSRLLTAYNFGAASNNGTKANPALSGDILGDWREEVIWRNSNNQELIVFTTTAVTNRRIHTLMHDPQYRLSIAWQNVAYNQPPHTSFFLGNGMATPPPPDIYIASGGPAATTYRLINRNSGKALDVNGCSTADGVNVQQWTSLNNNCQRWSVEDAGNGYKRLINVNSGKALDVDGCGTADGADVQQWTSLNNACQQWSLVTTDSGYVRVVNRNSGKVLDVANCGTGDGAAIRQWSWLNNTCQQWMLQP